MALPAAADFTGSAITEAQFKTAITDFRNYVADFEAVPPGVVVFYPKTTAPTGWLKANGAAISRTTYAALFSAIGTTFGAGDGSTTFNIPDLRGEFLRGLDNGRGVDSARVLGSAQGDDFKSHAHTQNIGGMMTNSGMIGSFTSDGITAKGLDATTTGATRGAETRPRNIALLACIKY